MRWCQYTGVYLYCCIPDQRQHPPTVQLAMRYIDFLIKVLGEPGLQ